MRTRLLMAGLVTGTGALIAVQLLLRDTYWDYSEGVYALTAHLMLHGGDLYGRIVGAQPPGVFLAGVGLLAIHDGLEWLRFGVGLLQLGAGLIAAEIVYRITGNRLATVLTPAAILLTPWAVHEHGALTPELVALPVMLGATRLSVDRRCAAIAGVLCGLLPLIKIPLVIPAVALVALSADRRRAGAWAGATLIAGLALTWLAGGAGFWRDVFLAQTNTGVRSFGMLKGLWAQAGWNTLGLLVCATVAGLRRAAAADRPLLRASIVLAVANVVTFLTNFKQGTGLNITVPVEASLVPLAACGTVFAFRAARSAPSPHRRLTAAACSVAAAFTLAQSVSLIASPHNPVPFLRAFSAPAWEITMTAPQLRVAVAVARACPRGAPYGGPPLIALIAGRSPPDDQPDQFLTLNSSTLAAVGARILATRGVCG
jgi:hypothetical protein